MIGSVGGPELGKWPVCSVDCVLLFFICVDASDRCTLSATHRTSRDLGFADLFSFPGFFVFLRRRAISEL